MSYTRIAFYVYLPLTGHDGPRKWGRTETKVIIIEFSRQEEPYFFIACIYHHKAAASALRAIPFAAFYEHICRYAEVISHSV